jgi:adenosylmethionine---8-amino-7-oxononanoate aminotransferase
MESSHSSDSPLWHPYTQMKTAGPPLHIERGEGAWLVQPDGNRILDLISSWWVNLHGHAHPHIAQAIANQASKLEQVIFAGFSHTPAMHLAQQLIQKLPGNPHKIFFSDNGSTAIEVALKMALQYWDNSGTPRHKILAFQSAYHGDTFGAMSVSARSVFTKPFQQQLFETVFLPDPGTHTIESILDAIDEIEDLNQVAAFIFEPLVLGSGGMIMYPPEVLNAMKRKLKAYNILFIADEVMTGFGRTGTLFASEQLNFAPDILCLSKGITGGFLPLGATSATKAVYQVFHDDNRMKTLFHGHSYTANPIACAAACASLELFDIETTLYAIKTIEAVFISQVQRFQSHPMVSAARSKGGIFAITLQDAKTAGNDYLSNIGPLIYNAFIQQNMLIRPLGNVLYLMPPYCISLDLLHMTFDRIYAFLDDLPRLLNAHTDAEDVIFG